MSDAEKSLRATDARNVYRQEFTVTRSQREGLNGHPGKVYWLTGLSGAGKSTLANALEIELHLQGKKTYLLDGDNIRGGLNKDLSFTEADRIENIRRVAEVAKLMLDAGLIVITAFISPFRLERRMARDLIGAPDFLEIYVNTPLSICERRDPKGLYRRARNGEIENLTGIGSPYEEPDNPYAIFDGSGKVMVNAAAKELANVSFGATSSIVAAREQTPFATDTSQANRDRKIS
ncbi:adenylyl-sulfate kinase [Rhizobium leguminosarum]|uniref:adenylyl-sulfate kinase n=1 Tax=Rhizobium leguminosarum TaxID=384 RepID=UPI002479C6BE|nr:adenylyl-sulfate kinase [Rhizobium leguminosarum]